MTIKNRIAVILFLLNIPLATVSYADSFSWNWNGEWHPVMTFGAGTSTTSDVGGDSRNYPIQNPVTDEFFNYTARFPTQTSGLLDAFLGAEWTIQPDWALQLGIDYNQAAPFSATGGLVQGADVPSQDTFTYHYSILSRQLLAEGKLLYTFNQRFHPYIMGGLGAAFNKSFNYSTSAPPFLTFTRLYSNNSQTSFSYAAGLGIDADITCYMRLGVGYRFASLGKAQLGSALIDVTPVAGTFSQSHLYTNEALVQLTWIF